MADSDKIKTRLPSVMEDPSMQAVASVYAEAYLNSAGENPEEALEELESFLDDVLHQNPEFENLLLSGILGRDEKIRLIQQVITPHSSDRFSKFLQVLASHDRLVEQFLPVLLAECHKKQQSRSGQKTVLVRTAKPLSDANLERVRERIQQVFHFEPLLEIQVDESLLGGMIIQVDDTLFDSSLRTRMKQLRMKLRERTFHEIQSGRDRFSHPEGD